MVSLYGIDDVGVFLILLGEVCAEAYVRAFLLVVYRFAYVVQKSRTLCKVDVEPQLLSHKPCKQGNLYRVPVNVLSVARPVFEPANQLYKLGVKPEDSHFEHRAFARLLYLLVEFLFDLFYRLFYARGMNSSVRNQLFKRKPCNFAPYGVEARKNYHFGSIVYDELYSRGVFKGAYVSALSSDYPCLHIVAGKRNGGYRRFCRMVGGAALNGKRDNLFGLVCGLFLCSLFNIPYLQGHVVTNVVKNLVGKELLCLVFGELGNLFEFLNHQFVLMVDFILGLFDFLFPVGKFFLLLFKGVGLLCQRVLPFIEIIFPLGKALFLLRKFSLLFFAFAFKVVSEFKFLFLCL